MKPSLPFLLWLCLFSVFSFAQTPTENYIKTTEYLTKTANLDSAIVTIMYYDGLGREKQLKQIGASPNENGTLGDLVTHFDYDGFGRQDKEYLPLPVGTTTQEIIQNIIPQYESFYGGAPHITDIYYSQKTLEKSPLNRLVTQAAPGNDWAKDAGHEIEFQYGTNTASEVWIYWMDGSGNLKKGNYTSVGDYYPANSLYKTTTTDENGHKIHEFKDKQGRVVLKRTYVAGGTIAGKNTDPGIEPLLTADTYYAYDVYGNEVGIIPPLASAKSKTDFNSNLQKDLCYTYAYDERNRKVEKKLPGKEKEFLVYDKQDRLVAVQDQVLRDQQKWLFTKYDKFGRMIYTGIVSLNKTRQQLQSDVNLFEGNNEERNTTGFTQNGITVYYTKMAFPTSFSDVLTVNYYDNYNNLNFTQLNQFTLQPVKTGNSQTDGNSLKGMQTASFVRVMGTNTWEKNFNVYDLKARPVGTYKTNHLGGLTKTESKLNFRGLPEYTFTKHKRTANGIEVTTKDEFTYDKMERLVKHTQSLNNSTTKNLIAQNEYDALGQLVSKKVGGTQTNATDRWQEINYTYNIRGWLTNINDIGPQLLGKDAQPPTQGDDLFAFRIQYNNLVNGGATYAEPLYNGNIAQTFWKTANDNTIRGYSYGYDQLNRLRNATYYKAGATPYTGSYDESLAYDRNGNILNLIRYTGDASNNQIDMDNLTYTYDVANGQSNRLLKVTDAVSGSNTGGFSNGNSGTNNDYTYDDNGNMLSDLNKGIGSISYNHLNLPTQVYWAADKKIDYIYNAAGIKVKKTVRDGNTIKVIDYLDGFQYAGGELQFFPTAEGYVKATPLSGEIGGATTSYLYNYVYNYTDHLGNIRMSYSKDPATNELKILDESHYYPFGLKHSVYAASTPKDFKESPGGGGETLITNVFTTGYQFKYNGKELQDELGLNVYDYGARNYDPALGRWMNIDPMAEMYYSHSTYNYTANNPVFFIDPNGMNLDVYEMDDQGNLTNIAESDRDVVYASKNFEGEGENRTLKADNDGGVDVGEKGFVEANMKSFSFNGISDSNGNTSSTHNVLDFGGNQEKALEYFKYAAENTNVEFNVITENSNSVVGTTHLSSGVLPFNSQGLMNIAGGYDTSNITLYGHSHPTTYSSAITPSGFELKYNSKTGGFSSSILGMGNDRVMAGKMSVNNFLYAPKYIEGAKTIQYNGSIVTSVQNGFKP